MSPQPATWYLKVSKYKAYRYKALLEILGTLKEKERSKLTENIFSHFNQPKSPLLRGFN